MRFSPLHKVRVVIFYCGSKTVSCWCISKFAEVNFCSYSLGRSDVEGGTNHLGIWWHIWAVFFHAGGGPNKGESSPFWLAAYHKSEHQYLY